MEKPSDVLNDLTGKTLDEIDIEATVERLRVARENAKNAKAEREKAKILTVGKPADEIIDDYDEELEASDIVDVLLDSKEQPDEKEVDKTGGSEKEINKDNKTKIRNIKGKAVNEDFLARAGAFMFFGIYGMIQIGLLATWFANGVDMSTLPLILLPTILVVVLFLITFLIDFVKLHNQNTSLQNKKKKKGGRH